MNIDDSKIYLTEKDIEDWLYENPRAISTGIKFESLIERWIGRQYHLPTGIADLIGVRENGKLVVVELKNVPINKSAVLQVCRYASDIEEVIRERMGYKFKLYYSRPDVERMIIGTGIDRQTFDEAIACGVKVLIFSVQMTLVIRQLYLGSERFDERQKQISAISMRDEWQIFGDHYTQHGYRLNKSPVEVDDDEFCDLDELLSASGHDQESDIPL